MNGKLTGFSRLDAVAVVLIAIILGFVFYPLFVNPSHRGVSDRRCLSNLKQLATASVIYRIDWDGRFMHRDDWMDVLVPYHKNKSIEYCPEVRPEPDSNPHLYGYAFDSGLSRKLEEDIDDPAGAPMFYDSVNLARNASDPLLSLPDPPRKHSGEPGNRIAYVDGHAKIARPKN